jgi:6-phosphofructokinase
MANQQRRKTDTRRPATSDDKSKPANTVTEPHATTEDGIRARAYELYLQRGHRDGHDWEDWFQAERELSGGASSAARRRAHDLGPRALAQWRVWRVASCTGRTMEHHDNLAILVGGGPAPGITGVIGAATIRARLEGLTVLGIQDGFERILQGDIDHVTPLTIDAISRIHFRGGSCIRISRSSPVADARLLDNAITSLLRLNVTQLITIGGDDTACAAIQLEARAAGRLHVAHVPKTIENDLDLPTSVDSFGFQTARHHGVEIVKNLMVDARTTSGWYFVFTMGRKAGHLALGIGKAVGATVTLIPEEFDKPIRLKVLVDTLVGAIIKRLSHGRRDGVAVIAEGAALELPAEDLTALNQASHDPDRYVRTAETNLGRILKAQVVTRLKDFGVKATIVTKNIGYELRCADPIPHDMEYARDLGYCAAKYLLVGGTGAMMSMQGGRFVPVPFSGLIDKDTGRTRVRLVNVLSTRYAIARRYMIRLRRDDFENPYELAKLAATAGLSPEDFRRHFEYLAHIEPPPLVFDVVHTCDDTLMAARRCRADVAGGGPVTAH